MEFSVPASVENLELSVPTHLVLTFCKEKPEFCIRMQGKGPCVAQTVLNQNRKNHGSEFRKLKELKKIEEDRGFSVKRGFSFRRNGFSRFWFISVSLIYK